MFLMKGRSCMQLAGRCATWGLIYQSSSHRFPHGIVVQLTLHFRLQSVDYIFYVYLIRRCPGLQTNGKKRTTFGELYCMVIRWKHFPRYRTFVRGIHRSPVNSPHKGQWRGDLKPFYLRFNKRLSKQWWGWLFKTPSCPIWRHRNGVADKELDTNRPSIAGADTQYMTSTVYCTIRDRGE